MNRCVWLAIALASASITHDQAFACSPLHQTYLRKQADVVVRARVSVVDHIVYQIETIDNDRGVARATAIRVIRGERRPDYRVIFDSENDGINCPQWTPMGRKDTQTLYLKRSASGASDYRVITSAD